MKSLIRGLSAAQVAKRVAAGQVNKTNSKTSRSLGDILRANIFTRFNALLGVLFVVVMAVGSPADALFGWVIVINSAIGVVQEVRAKRLLDKLALLNAPTARVLRDGRVQIIALPQVVIDDVLELQIGDAVPADAAILQSDGLEVDESLLTGESDAIDKKTDDNVLSGSIVVAGRALAKVTAVGDDAYISKMAAQVKRFSRARSELVDGTNKLLGYMSWVIVVVTPLLVWGQLTHGDNWQAALVRSTAAIVGMIPEGLVLLTSLAFMVAALALARRKVLVQQLPAVEGLARVDVVCLDKTGTLTEGSMELHELIMIVPGQRATVTEVLATFAEQPNSPTLQALHDAFPTQSVTVLDTVPFSSARKWSALSVASGHWVMGAPEILLPTKNAVREKADSIAEKGNRVLVLLKAQHMPTAARLPVGEPIALIVLAEKIRSDAKETLRYFADQGVALKVISGDNPRTVGAVARMVGMPPSEPFDARNLSQDIHELADVLEKNNVFGRVTPEQKRAMVHALQSRGHVVAMTGDGVNDAMALKDADIGIAMASGAQATKSVAELVLLDNSFAHMPHVLAEGRRVIANIERAASLFVIKNVYSLCLALAVTLVALPYPFLPRHLTVISALSIGIPAFFLSLAPNTQRYVPGFLRRVLLFSAPVGALIAALVVAGYLMVINNGGSAALGSTVASVIIMTTGTWVLACVARPIRYWKVVLIAVLDVLFIALLLWPQARALLDYQMSGIYILPALLLSAVGVVGVELMWRHRGKKTSFAAPKR